jgi:hypothetical protein
LLLAEELRGPFDREVEVEVAHDDRSLRRREFEDRRRDARFWRDQLGD